MANQQTYGVFSVENDTTAFGKSKAAGTIIFNKANNAFYRLTAAATPTTTLATATKVTAGSIPISIENPIGNAFISGDLNTEGSHYFTINPDTGFAIIYKIISGIAQPATLSTGPNSLFVGLRVGIAAAGHHIITEDTDGHYHFHAHSKWDGELSESDARILDAYNYEARRVMQPDNTGSVTNTAFEFAFPAAKHGMIAKAYFQTDTTVATTPVRIQAWGPTETTYTSGTLVVGKRYLISAFVAGDDFTNVGASANVTGVAFTATGTTPTTWTNSTTITLLSETFDQYYPASDFTASSEQALITAGFLEFFAGETYYFRISSSTTMSFKTDATNTYPWFAVDVSDVHEDDILQSTEWVSGDSFALGQWKIDGKKIYVCNTAGVQTGTFASNSALWSLLGNFVVGDLGVSGNATISGDVNVTGDVVVGGSITSTSIENLLVTDSHILLNNGYQTVAAKMGGVTVNYLPTSTADTVSAGAFVAGIAATSNPTVATVGAATFAQNDLVMINASAENNGLFEVHSHAANLLTVRGIGTVPRVEGFTNNQFITNASDTATITKINVSVLCSSTSGDWRQGKGAVTPITFVDIGDDLWIRTGTVLSPLNAGDDVLIENVGASLLTVKSTGVGSVYAKILIDSATNSSIGIVGVSDAKGYFERGGQYWEHGMPWNTGTPDYNLDYVIRRVANTTPDFGVDKDDGRVYTIGELTIGGGITDGATATTQSPLDNSTKLATTAYVEAAVSVEGLWDKSGTTLSNKTGIDIINFILGGVTKWRMTGSTLEALNTGDSVFIGEDAGINDDLSDNKNTFIGASAGKLNTTGFFNTSLGFGALQANTTGGSNIAMGTVALGSNVTGSTNVAIGNNAIGSNNSGGSNVAVGNAALLSTTGSFNVGVGTSALRNNTSGASNVAVGHDAGYALGAGSSNIAVGRSALGTNSSGSNNICIGYQTGINNLVGSGNVFIGYQAGANETGSNKLYIANSYTYTPLIYGDFDTPLLRVNGVLDVTGNINTSGSLYQTTYGDSSHLVMDFNFSDYGSAQHQYDYSSGSITTTVASTPLTSTTYGKFGSGVLLAASQGWSYEPPTNYPTGAVVRTVEFWCKPTTVTAGRETVFSYGSAAGYSTFGVGMNNGQAQLAFFGSNNDSGTTDFVAGNWYLCHATYDGTTAKMYVNNVEKVSVIAPLTTGSDYSVIGGYGSAGSETFQGNIAQLKMYDRVLSEDERKTSYLRHSGNSVIKTGSSVLKVTPLGITSNDGTRDRLIVDDVGIFLQDSVGYAKLRLQGGAYSVADSANKLRFIMDVTASSMTSPNEAFTTNNRDTYSSFSDATRDRVKIDATDSRLVSPDGTQILAVPNSGVTLNGNTITTHAATTHDIFTTAQLTALATASLITVSGTLTLNIKATLTSSVIYDLTTGSTLVINISEGVNYISSTTGDFFSGSGSLRLNGGVLLAVAGGTLFNYRSTNPYTTTQQIDSCQLYGWDLGTVDLSTMFIRRSAVINHTAPMVFKNMAALKIIDFGFARIGSGAIADSIFELESGDRNIGNIPEVLISDVTGKLLATDSFINVKPCISSYITANITSTLVGIDGTLFNTTGSTGTFTAVADASIGATAITSVTDSSGVARFNFTTPTVYAYQDVVISGFTTNTAYNGTHQISSTDGTSWFEVYNIDFGSDETGSFLSNSVTLTDTGTSLANGDCIGLDTDLSTAYDVGSNVYNKQTNTVQINGTWSATATGSWSEKSLNEDSRYIEVSNSGQAEESHSTLFAFVNTNSTTTTFSLANTWYVVELGTVVEGLSTSRFKYIGNNTFKITTLAPLMGVFEANLSGIKTGSDKEYEFRINVTSGTGSFDSVIKEHTISSGISSFPVKASGFLYPGDEFQIEARVSSTSQSEMTISGFNGEF